ncbi:MAG: carboxypeptidase regulatory-like domain-containing protein, partial [Planctomycetota bacterium JB042]
TLFRSPARDLRAARRVGRRPDTVRVQLSRGLSLLRGMLPAGIAGGLLLSASARKSLAAVRVRVLEHAAGGAAPLPSAGLFSLGGLLMVNKVLIGVLGVVLLATAARLLWSDGEPAGREEAPSVAVASAEVPPKHPSPSASPERTAASPAADDVTAPADPSPASAPRPAAETAGLTGRLLLDGAPVEGVEVTLLRVAVEELTGSLARTLLGRDESPLRACGGSTTDGEGRFAFDHAPTHSVLALGIDLGGGRATVRAVEAALAPERTASVGDIELGPVTALSGRVVDEEDRPIAGATVRAVLSPVPIALVGGERFRPDAVVVRGDDEVTPLPAWVEPWWTRFPAPRAVTGADGRFTLGGVARGVVSLVVHAEGRRPIAKATPTGNVPARDVGDLRLDAGRTLEGRVLDAAGAPVAGAAVFAGVHSVLADCAFAAPAVAPTDSDGRFAVRGLPEFGDLTVAVRAGPRDGFRVDRPGDVEEVELRLAPTTALVVDLVGTELPAPGRIEVAAVRAGAGTPSLAGEGAARHPAESVDGRRFVFERLRPGGYVVLVAVDGAARPFPVELPPGGASIEVAAPTPTRLDVRVVDDASGAPISGATVGLRRLDVRPAHPVEAITAEDGTAALGPVSFDGIDTRPSPRLVASHPAYGRSERRLDAAPDGVVEVRFAPTGSVEGRVTIAGEPPSRPLLVTVYEDDGFLGFMTGVPTLVTTDARGAFTIPALAAGSWLYRVGPRYLEGDLVAALPALTSPPESIARGGFEVRSGETTTVEVDAITADSAVACKVVGRVTLDGRPLEDARVFVHPLGRSAETGARGGSATTDVTGAYEIDSLPPGMVRVVVHRVARTERGFHMNEVFERDVELRPGGVLPLDVALRATRVEFLVVGED